VRRFGRTLPPAATPIRMRDFIAGLRACLVPGRATERFRSDVAASLGIKYCFVVSSGKAALTLILLALKELSPDRDEVLIPAFTCYSVPSSVLRAKLKIRLCDLQTGGLDFDFVELSRALQSGAEMPASAERASPAVAHSPWERERPGHRALSNAKSVLAVISTHLYGMPADVLKARAAVADPKVTVIEDAAQALGETCKSGRLGTLGDVSFFSLGRGKAYSVVEGGVILTNREDIGQALDRLVGGLQSYGVTGTVVLAVKALAMMVFTHPRMYWLPKSMSFLKLGETLVEPSFPMLKMSAFQAGLGRHWRKGLQALREERMNGVAHWLEVLRPSQPGDLGAGDVRNLALPRLPVRIENRKAREALLQASGASGLGIMAVYPEAISRLPAFAVETGSRACPAAERCAAELVTLPTHRYLRKSDFETIGTLVRQALAARSTVVS
jgi:perosamine synthetase